MPPPDVIAHFSADELAIEITSIDPSHVRQSDTQYGIEGGGRGRTLVPISYRPQNKEEAWEIMNFFSDHPKAWENVTDRNATWVDIITDRVASKLSNKKIIDIGRGIILLPGQLEGNLGEEEAVKMAFEKIRDRLPNSTGWTLATCYKWNHIEYFSCIHDPELGFHKMTHRHH